MKFKAVSTNDSTISNRLYDIYSLLDIYEKMDSNNWTVTISHNDYNLYIGYYSDVGFRCVDKFIILNNSNISKVSRPYIELYIEQNRRNYKISKLLDM